MFSQLNILCRFNSSKQHKFQLLYRGSRDGFSAADFHSKCDSRANTITIIETSKGFVFGAFTQASWSSGESGVYKLDPNAFLFSLVNPFEKPFVCQITKPDYAIYCEASKGPTFGKWPDIQLCYDLSSVTVDGHVNSIKSELTRSYDRPSDFVIDDPDGLYFCESEHFHVREIEVFQIV